MIFPVIIDHRSCHYHGGQQRFPYFPIRPILKNKGNFTVCISPFQMDRIFSINDSTGLMPVSALYFCTDDQVVRYP